MTQSLRSIPFTSKKCGNCGHRNAPNANFCSQCGMKLDSTPLNVSPSNNMNTAASQPQQGVTGGIHLYTSQSSSQTGHVAQPAQALTWPVAANSDNSQPPQNSAENDSDPPENEAQEDKPPQGSQIVPPNPSITSGSTSNVGVKCAKCGHQNRPGALVCEKCFELLTTSPTTVPTNYIPQEALAQMRLNTIDAWNESTGSFQGVQPGTSVFQPNMLAALRFKGSAADTLTLRLNRQPVYTMGRIDPTQNLKPDIDMTPYAGQQLGVSRQHAVLELKGTGVYLTDLRSSNGTFLNDTRLAPHEPHQVRDGDTIRLGQLEMRLYFQIQQGPS